MAGVTPVLAYKINNGEVVAVALKVLPPARLQPDKGDVV